MWLSLTDSTSLFGNRWQQKGLKMLKNGALASKFIDSQEMEVFHYDYV